MKIISALRSALGPTTKDLQIQREARQAIELNDPNALRATLRSTPEIHPDALCALGCLAGRAPKNSEPMIQALLSAGLRPQQALPAPPLETPMIACVSAGNWDAACALALASPSSFVGAYRLLELARDRLSQEKTLSPSDLLAAGSVCSWLSARPGMAGCSYAIEIDARLATLKAALATESPEPGAPLIEPLDPSLIQARRILSSPRARPAEPGSPKPPKP